MISALFITGCRNQQSAGIVDDNPKAPPVILPPTPTPSIPNQHANVSIGSGISRSSSVYAKIKAGSSKKLLKSNNAHAIIMEK